MFTFKPLLQALSQRDRPGFFRTLSEHPDIVNQDVGGRYGGTIVHEIIRQNNLEGAEKPGWLDLLTQVSGSPAVDWNLRDKAGRTPLLLAIENDLFEVSRFLLAHNADVGISDASDCCALHYAIHTRNKELLALLLSHAADTVDQKDKDGMTPLHLACALNQADMAEMLITEGADVNAKSKTGETPLHVAADQNAVEAARVLLRYDALRISPNQSKDTPEMVARDNGHQDMVDLLRTPVDISSPQRQPRPCRVRVPKPSQKQTMVAEKFKGLVWPAVEGDTVGNRKYTEMSIFEMLYQKYPEPKLGPHVRNRVRWIHIPANNSVWIQDVFKRLYSSDQSGNNEKQKTGGSSLNEQQNSDATVFQQIRRFINNQFAELETLSQHRYPQVKIAYGKRSEKDSFPMLALVLPVIDVDLQQPAYYKPPDVISTTPGKPTPASLKDQPPEEELRAHIAKLQELREAYPDAVEKSRTLDGYIHPFMDETNLHFRNGDQVVSRFIERDRRTYAEKLRKQVRAMKADKASDSSRTSSSRDSNSAIKQVVEDPNGVKTTVRLATGEMNIPISPAQLESQTWPVTRRSPWGSWHLKLRRSWSDLEEFFSKRRWRDSDSESEEDQAGEETTEKEIQALANEKIVRQQILTVPQLWLWRIEGTVVTSFPENYRLTQGHNSAFPLSQAILNALLQIPVPGDLDASQLVNLIISTCLDFEPKLLMSKARRAYLDAFGDEIAYVSSKVTTCYESFRRDMPADIPSTPTAGGTIAHFQPAMQGEMGLLVRIDDILGEIAMIQRVHHDQDRVCLLLQTATRNAAAANGSTDGMYMASSWGDSQSPQSSQAPDMAPLSSARPVRSNSMPLWGDEGSGNGSRWNGEFQVAQAQTECSGSGNEFQSQSFTGLNKLRSDKSKYLVSRLDRLAEDATRVRNSIITLLDLRQRQAITENALSSATQEDLLFSQSNILFVFTVATVIFAPLAWISGVMELNIKGFTPEDEAWTVGTLVWASLGTVMVTFALFVVVYLFNNWWITWKNKARGRFPWGNGMT